MAGFNHDINQLIIEMANAASWAAHAAFDAAYNSKLTDEQLVRVEDCISRAQERIATIRAAAKATAERAA